MKIRIERVAIVLFLLLFLILFLRDEFRGKQLDINGDFIKGNIIEYYHIGKSTNLMVRYKFIYKNKEYIGNCVSPNQNPNRLEKEKVNKCLIKFLPSNPEVNRFIKRIE